LVLDEVDEKAAAGLSVDVVLLCPKVRSASQIVRRTAGGVLVPVRTTESADLCYLKLYLLGRRVKTERDSGEVEAIGNGIRDQFRVF
jgi:cellobiose-specific phosphotransferase system component IIB